ncbi:hypothetical protein T03_11893 [Trichinella britovi]|uniref:Uncharacterized protein n=1 Tax=Trichinella britovi TaxID=45882 RepID=A0A0V1D8R3_TRIBR|nr:hypothetical protein T03_11893 [Trichinella britovi]
MEHVFTSATDTTDAEVRSSPNAEQTMDSEGDIVEQPDDEIPELLFLIFDHAGHCSDKWDAVDSFLESQTNHRHQQQTSGNDAYGQREHDVQDDHFGRHHISENAHYGNFGRIVDRYQPSRRDYGHQKCNEEKQTDNEGESPCQLPVGFNDGNGEQKIDRHEQQYRNDDQICAQIKSWVDGEYKAVQSAHCAVRVEVINYTTIFQSNSERFH